LTSATAVRLANIASGPPFAAPQRTRLPSQLTTFVGRQDEVSRIVRLLALTRLLTLTGPGGSGKTRLALRVATEVRGEFEDGVWFVDFASLFEPSLVLPTVAQVLGIHQVGGQPALDSVAEVIGTRRMLLLLDNLEHLLAAAPEVQELLVACPQLTVLATSRTPLRVAGEQEFAVPPLALPDLSGSLPDTVELAENEAVQLFVDRARAIRPDFQLTSANAVTVAEICRHLDGLPLAIELAAARVRLLEPSSVLARLRHGSDAGTTRPGCLEFLRSDARGVPDRQRTLRSAINWSYALLSEDEQALFRRLSVFAGGCSLEAAEAAACAPDLPHLYGAATPTAVLDAVESLVSKALLRSSAAEGGEPRLNMLETIREFARERAAEHGELASMQRWHARYYAEFAERTAAHLRDAEQRAALNRIEREHDNLRTALDWSVAHDRRDDLALRLGGSLASYWACRGHVSEGRRWLDRALACTCHALAARVNALIGAGWLAHVQRDMVAARQHLEAALDLSRHAGGKTQASALHLLGRVAYFDGDSASARSFAERSLIVARDQGDAWQIAWALHLLGLAAHLESDYSTAGARYEEALSIRRELGYAEGVGICLTLLAIVAFRKGDLARAARLGCQGLRVFDELGADWTIHNALVVLAAVAAALGQPHRAVRLAGAIDAFSQRVDVTPIPIAEKLLAEVLPPARQTLGPDETQAAWEDGRRLALPEATADALGLEAAAGDVGVRLTTGPAGVEAGLTARETDVLRLIAAGQTTREIADSLVISISTVERHITHIYTKINARGRADATAYALLHGLGSR
jgi:predicted ATPase/DNA-binding CsgD family transcriptional regulator